MATNSETKGAALNAAELATFVEQIIDTNVKEKKMVPVCIWGTHGIGKTDLIEQIARRHGWQFTYAAPAQFEEMGDLHGLPIIDGDATTFASPEWVPTKPGPGILLLDDLNRADDRILRGLMQLLQKGEMISWSLPEQWQIVATANPEGGDYSVTPMDDALLTRMLHATLKFDAKIWAKWAHAVGVDKRGIDFVLSYPESVTGIRTTPRSLAQFFQQIQPFSDLEANWNVVHALAASALDDTTASSFMSFVKDGLANLLQPEEILDAKSFASVSKKLTKVASDENGIRLDRLSTICTRLYLELTSDSYKASKKHQRNLVSFMKHEALPNDLRTSLHQDILRDGDEHVAEMMRDKELAELSLASF